MFEAWLEILRETTGTDHHKKYSSFWNNKIKRRIGRVKIGALTEQHLQDIINAEYKNGLAKKSLENLRACMVSFVKYARKCKATVLLPENLTIPKGAAVGEKIILQPDDMRLLFSCDSSTLREKEVFEPLVYAWRLQVLTGLRPGELLGLRWSDIDLKGKVIGIKQSINGHNEITTGKNDNAQRVFALTDEAQRQIIEYKSKLPKSIVISEYIFPDPEGDFLSQSSNLKRWTRYKKHNGINPAVTLYGLRHTFVSIFKGLPEGYLKAIVGHSIKMDTYRTYGHAFEGDLEQAATLMQERLKDVLGK